ncbi:putative N-acetyltransferase YhbS [Clostridium tetanomorphum]|uniref:GNAT family N-acetyltransferase n=1 Tax=Clostridium tetanomorphum TaxID=1553 RepID=A0A923EC99_CLOTT|nr:GNAT family N-acetyltransferase [Clostridium tetanomorphum]KAJ53078.1 acetyltransferase [Clostridium tetanomorphum DSM 665]MBC2398384.1 GNAT family N-acetyltransferase [Clostridium tetanomorphum]MBP1865537.1 putative N-acetyltransferase YhbS [Clostridium tetanomorphum]NRS86483.1 putative N-acetyltransferase YhbS [Clostridium tetanomorphum]NRZ95488.1 putative N-acetyltransferase YhbS [Clostridium tetanomorphum]
MQVSYRFITKKEMKNIIKVWNDNIGCFFPMDEKLFCQNIEGDKNLLKKDILGAFVEEDLVGFIIFKQQLKPRGIIEADKTQGNINSLIVDFKYRNIGIGSYLLYKCENILQARGIKHIEVGRDTFHFFPGVPLEFKDGYKFFNKRGYKDSYSSSDLICDISSIDFSKLKNLKRLKLNENKEYVVLPFNKDEEEKLICFFKEAFPGRWLEAIKYALNNDADGEDIIIMKDIKKDIVIGFSRVYHKDSKVIGPPIYWRKLLGENFGGLGPIGIHPQYRQKTLGLTLLFKSLEILKNRHVENICIDWTELYKFYGIFNFIPWKSYVHMGKDFSL